MVVYQATNIINNKSYIGITKNFRTRKARHIRDSLLVAPSSIFHRAIRKYGVNNFEWKILYEFDESCYNMPTVEESFIRMYDTHFLDGHGYNMLYTCVYPDIENLSRKNKGKVISEATRMKQSMRLKGRKFSPEHCKKIGDAQRGKKKSPEQIWKSVATRKRNAIPVSLETKQKMSIAHAGSKNHFFGKTHSAETLEILKEKCKKIRHKYLITKLESGEQMSIVDMMSYCKEFGYTHTHMYSMVNHPGKIYRGMTGQKYAN